jgi:hypothetical protein
MLKGDDDLPKLHNSVACDTKEMPREIMLRWLGYL